MTLDLLQLAGGRELIFQTLLATCSERVQAADALGHLVRSGAESALHAELRGELTLERELFTMMNGERPHAPSDDADTWDDQFSAALLPVFEKFAARAGVPQDWIIEALNGNVIDDPDALNTLAELTAQHMVAYQLRKAKTTNTMLSAIGIVQKDIDAAYAPSVRAAEVEADEALTAALNSAGAADCSPRVGTPVEEPEEEPRYDFMSVDVDPLAEFGLSEADSGPVEPVSPAPVQTAAPSPEPAPATRAKRTTKASGGKCVTLPNVIFRSIRKLGVADKEVSASVGIARSTWARVAGGDAEEMGLTAEQAAGLMGYLSDLQAQVQHIVDTCGLYGLQAKGGAS